MAAWQRGVGAVAATCVMLASSVAATAASADFDAPTYVRTVGQPGHAGVYAWGATTAADGSILVGDYWNYAIRRYDPDGTLLQTFGQKGFDADDNQGPYGLATDPNDGSIYMADFELEKILKYDADGVFQYAIDTNVADAVPYSYLVRVAVNSVGDVYAINSHSIGNFQHRVFIWDDEGNFKSSFGTNGDAPGEFGLLRGLAIGPDDEVYIGDAGKGLIQVFDADGTYLRAIGEPGSGPGRFAGDMRGIVVDPDDGWVYAVDATESQIEKFTLDGEHLLTWGAEGTGEGEFRDGGRELTIGPDNNVYAPDYGGFRMHVFTPEGAWLRSFPDDTQPPPGGFNQAQDVTVNRTTGHLWVADTYNHRMQEFDQQGDFVQAMGFRGSTDPDAMNYPRGVAVDQATGDVWLNNTREGNIKQFTEDGTFVSQFGEWGHSLGADFAYARGIHVQGDRVYIADGLNRHLKVFDKVGNIQWAHLCGDAGDTLSGCTGVTVDPDGFVYAATSNRHTIMKFSPDGQLLWEVGQNGSGPGDLRLPYDLVAWDGLLYVTDSYNHRVSVFDLDGAYVGAFGSRGTDHGQFVHPRGIDVDGTGNLYVTDSQNERIEVFALGEGNGPAPGPDTVAPDGVIAGPDGSVAAGPVVLDGTASDDVGVAEVVVAVRDRDRGAWLHADGSWGGYEQLPADLSDPAATATDWSVTLDLPAGRYGFHAVARDAAGNVDPSPQWMTFTTVDGDPGPGPDTVAPELSVVAPSAGGAVATPVAVTGFATDDRGVATVDVAVQDRATRQWLHVDGTWGGFARLPVTLADPDQPTTDWSLDVELPAGGYGLIARALDDAPNVTTTPWLPFTVE